MKTVLSGHTRDDDAEFADSELALAISPCPKLEQPTGTGETGELARARSPQAYRPIQTAFDGDELTGTLTIGWALALAIAVALVILVSGD